MLLWISGEISRVKTYLGATLALGLLLLVPWLPSPIQSPTAYFKKHPNDTASY